MRSGRDPSHENTAFLLHRSEARSNATAIRRHATVDEPGAPSVAATGSRASGASVRPGAEPSAGARFAAPPFAGPGFTGPGSARDGRGRSPAASFGLPLALDAEAGVRHGAKAFLRDHVLASL